MKQKILLILVAVFATATTAWAIVPTNGSCGSNATWSYATGTKILTISGTGDMGNYSNSNQPWKAYKDVIEEIVIEDGVTSIGAYAFDGCTGLTTVIIGSGVTSIGEDAFSSCEKVTDVYCYANPTQLTWIDSEDEGEVCDDFITNPKDPNYPTRCHVKEADLATFKSKWSQGEGHEDTDINVEFVSSTFNIDITIGNPTSGAPRTSILGNGADEQTYTNTPTVWGIGALKAPDSNTVTIGSDVKLPFTKTLSELMGDKATGNLKNAAVTSGTNVAVGDFDGWNTEITVLGTGTSVVTLVMQDESPLPITFNVAETIFVLSEAVGITTGNVENIKGKVAQFSRVFTPGVVSTLCLPFSMTSDLEGTLYEFKDVTYNAEAGAWVADFTQEVEPTEDAPTVAGKPYLFRAYTTVTNDMPLLFSGKVANRFSGLAGTSESNHADGGTWTFHGTYNELSYSETLTGDVYGFAGAESAEEGVSAGDFVKAVTGAKVPAFRCYLTYSDGNGGTSLSRGDTNSLPSRIIVRLIGLDGQTTAIGTMDTRTGEVRLSDEWYSLDGRKLEGQPTKEGIYINKGKKKRIKN